MGELLRLLNLEHLELADLKISSAQLATLLKLIDQGIINGKIAKTIFETMFQTGKDPEAIVKEQGLVQINNSDELVTLAQKVITANPQSVADYLGGKEQALKFLIGQMMKESKGRANPGLVNEVLKQELERQS